MPDPEREALPTPSAGVSGSVWRFSTLLATIVLILLSGPMIDSEDVGIPFSRILFSAILIAGIYVVSTRRAVFFTGLALALPALATEWIVQFHPHRALIFANLVLTGLFLVYIAAVILHEILDEDRVTLDTIFGGVCVYVMLGIVWVVIYTSLELFTPGSFLVGGAALQDIHAGQLDYRFDEFTYFSFVTMTTLGYGDIVPTTGPARAFAAAEAIVGQLYVAIFVARLVALHLVHQREGDPQD
jgi:hypothetical protein